MGILSRDVVAGPHAALPRRTLHRARAVCAGHAVRTAARAGVGFEAAELKREVISRGAPE
jgi:ribosomal protein L13E